MRNKKYVYHYHLSIDMGPTICTHIDGILYADTPIESMEQYRQAKREILGDFDIQYEDKATIKSFSLIGKTTRDSPGE